MDSVNGVGRGFLQRPVRSSWSESECTANMRRIVRTEVARVVIAQRLEYDWR